MTDKEFWEWCGFKPTRLQSGNMGWLYPPEYSLERGYLPDSTLDNLFKYAVPKLIREGYSASLHASYFTGNYKGIIDKYDSDFRVDNIWDKDPAQALKKAIEKVIENG